ncbi:MAG: tetratricopeptide repeat protein [Candidatus Cloacimonadota bacterium]|mgnify:FL=1|jgi:tetratricopeptide (TPR) repeat protein|nr:tetratricopeptide repeat protein [Candidatus Cloacimonas sp.]MDD3605751.1 tetratricopeptide repeat protein [Candidatus Cloacimonas acidaminovorans]MDI9571974.1 tetratricopeptide repeat protein [Candidatus Cloacimonadota bacterium]MDD5407179.1 tetratricopeptide repeat protein [Candidatus Cloacimonas acidaminovorans]HNV61363.1 tetratricopeptide repeat protein [Candidatus Cloacimonas acidaminovorans]
MKQKIMTFVVLVLLVLLSACGSNKKVQAPVEPVRNPLILAHSAAARGTEAFNDEFYNDAISAFTEAISLFNEAALTATPADSVAENIEKMNLNIAKSYIELANESMELSSFDEALDYYSKALNVYKSITPKLITQEELQQNIIGIYNNMAITAKQAGKYEQALTYYDQILKLTPNDADVLYAKFYVLRDNIKDENRAYAVLIDYAELTQDAKAFINVADSYAEKGNLIEAGKYYQKALAIEPSVDLYRRLANYYSGLKDYNNANLYLQKVADSNPEPSELAQIYALMAKNYEGMNDKKKMVEYYEKSLSIERNPQLALLLASYYNSQKNYAKVISNANITLSIDPKNADALMLRGVSYYQMKNYSAAKADLERLQNDPKYGTQAKNLLKNIPK